MDTQKIPQKITQNVHYSVKKKKKKKKIVYYVFTMSA